MADVPAEDEPGPDLRHVALGVTVVVGEGLVAAARSVADATRAVGAPVVAATPEPVRARARRLAADLDARGRDAVATAGRLSTDVATQVARQPAVLRMVDEVVDQVIGPVIDNVLPGVLDRLADEPDQVRRIVQGQSRGMADELAQVGRGRAVQADEAVVRLFPRLLPRQPPRPRTVAGPAPIELHPPVDGHDPAGGPA